MIDTIVDIGYTVLKVLAIIVIVGIFAAAIKTFLGLIGTIIFPNIAGEILGLVSMYLPFNALAIFDSLATAISAILVFLIARKIFDLTGWSFSLT